MSQQKFILGKDLLVKSFDITTYTNVNAILLTPLPSSIKPSTNNIDNVIQIFNNGVEIPEISDLEVDALTSVGKFCCGSDQVIRLLIAKDDATIKTLTDAKNSFNNNIEIYADFREDLKIDPSMYDLTIYDSTGNKLFNSNPIGLTQIQSTIDSWTKTVDITEIGIPKYVIKHLVI